MCISMGFPSIVLVKKSEDFRFYLFILFILIKAKGKNSQIYLGSWPKSYVLQSCATKGGYIEIFSEIFQKKVKSGADYMLT